MAVMPRNTDSRIRSNRLQRRGSTPVISESSGEITRLLIALKSGRREAEEALFPIVYKELRAWQRTICGKNVGITPCRQRPWFMKLTYRLVAQNQVDVSNHVLTSSNRNNKVSARGTRTDLTNNSAIFI
jgi:hypothetical protein